MKRKQQQGVALLMAVLIAALVTTAAVAMASRQQLDVRRTANIFNSDQAFIAALGAEDYARDVLVTGRKPDATDQGNNPAADHEHEPWAQLVVFPFEDMTLAGQMTDMQGRFNLNNLLDENGDPIKEQVQYFKDLLDELGLDQSIADAVIDWMDDDNDTQGFGGAETGDYSRKNPPYGSANAPFVSVSELLLIEGIDFDSYQTLIGLEPKYGHVSVLPRALENGVYKQTPINVNTASREVLIALNPDKINEAIVDQIVDDRQNPDTYTEYTDTDTFLTDVGLGPAATPPIPTVPVAIISDHFLLNASAEFDESRGYVTSLLKFISDENVVVVMRSRGTY